MYPLWLTLLALFHYPSPVRMLSFDTGRCSMVAMSADRALTAAHCLHGTHLRVGDVRVTGHPIGSDLAELRGHFSPPYAHPGPIGDRLIIEGWGCGAALTRGIGAFREVTRLPGLELHFRGHVCRGDSGGALWTDGGGLAGILTARGVGKDRGTGYATIVK